MKVNVRIFVALALFTLALSGAALAQGYENSVRATIPFNFYAGGAKMSEKEVRAWQVKKGATAPQASGVIHTDFERGFIRAEIYTLEDLKQHKTESAIKAAGRLRAEGKAYVMKDGDITHFLFNV